MLCYFLVIFSLASSHKANYLTEPQAGLCACIHPTQELWCCTFTSQQPSGMLSPTPSARAVHSVLWVSSSEQPRATLQFGYLDELPEQLMWGWAWLWWSRFGSIWVPAPRSQWCWVMSMRHCALQGFRRGTQFCIPSALRRNSTSRLWWLTAGPKASQLSIIPIW